MPVSHVPSTILQLTQSLKVEASERPAAPSPSGRVPELSAFVFSARLVLIPREQVSKSTFGIFRVH